MIVLQRIDAAIERLLSESTTPTIERSISNLKAKRLLVESDKYTLRLVNEEACAAVGREIAIMTTVYWCKNYSNAKRARGRS